MSAITASVAFIIGAWSGFLHVLGRLLIAGSVAHQKKTRGYRSLEFLFGAVFMGVLIQLFFYETPYWYSYAFFFSALLITLRTDATTFLISRLVTLYCVPIGWFLSYKGWLPLTLFESVVGALVGFGILFLVNSLSRFFLGRDGLGQGDIDLMAFIGSFTGVLGCWVALMIGSLLGSVFGIVIMTFTGRSRYDFLLPFGCFLVVGALIFVLFQNQFYLFLFP